MTTSEFIKSVVNYCLTPQIVTDTEFLTQKDIIYKQLKINPPLFYEYINGIIKCYNSKGIELGIPIRLRESLDILFSKYAIHLEPTVICGTVSSSAKLKITDIFFKSDTQLVYPVSKRVNLLQKLALYSTDPRIEWQLPTWTNAGTIYSDRHTFNFANYLLYPSSKSFPITLENYD